MALTFPLSRAAFADQLRIASFRWSLREFVETSGTVGGQPLVNEIAARRWAAEVELAVMTRPGAADLRALFAAIGPGGTFYLHDATVPGPRADPTGAGLGGAAPVLNTLGGDNRSLRLAGLPAGYVISRGDMLGFEFGSPARRALHQVVETVTASGAGVTPLFEVRPFLRPGYATGAAVTLVKPGVRMMLVPGSFDPGTAGPVTVSGMAFQAIEVR
ncbi:hypothetical protein [Amaricoccus sp.]|uniref:hypothetical protein n=1 Tax=Amaricoccus sp. TaxID=1872485 RepID=UPI0026279814|nr:hypothetical protein [uncultured Amaricoccus sp.]